MTDEQSRYASKPTRFTVFQRTFLPLQMIRFVVINLKMLDIIRRSHAGMNRHARDGAGGGRTSS